MSTVHRATEHAPYDVSVFTNGILDPEAEMLGPIADGSYVKATTAPGCWGPMITPELKGGHEVTRPLAVAGAEVGDAVAIHIHDIVVRSRATASGTDEPIVGRFVGDPYIAGKCPECGEMNPNTRVDGVGASAVRCSGCDAEAAPFLLSNGYTIAFDDEHGVGITVGRDEAISIGEDARAFAAMPEASIQNSVLVLAPHDLVGVATRVRPFLGQFGTTPAIALPDSHNAGDLAPLLVGAPHDYAIEAEDLRHRTDGHMDIESVRSGATLICPVKVPGAGIYVGDMHAVPGDGEIAGHTCDVAGEVTFQVELIKGLTLDGPLLFPPVEDLPPAARPLSASERAQAVRLGEDWNVEPEVAFPISIVGSAPDLNAATQNGLERAASLLEMSVLEVKNRATITGAIEIGRLPGVVQVTLLAPVDRLEKRGLSEIAKRRYEGPAA